MCWIPIDKYLHSVFRYGFHQPRKKTPLESVTSSAKRTASNIQVNNWRHPPLYVSRVDAPVLDESRRNSDPERRWRVVTKAEAEGVTTATPRVGIFEGGGIS